MPQTIISPVNGKLLGDEGVNSFPQDIGLSNSLLRIKIPPSSLQSSQSGISTHTNSFDTKFTGFSFPPMQHHRSFQSQTLFKQLYQSTKGRQYISDPIESVQKRVFFCLCAMRTHSRNKRLNFAAPKAFQYKSDTKPADKPFESIPVNAFHSPKLNESQETKPVMHSNNTFSYQKFMQTVFTTENLTATVWESHLSRGQLSTCVL